MTVENQIEALFASMSAEQRPITVAEVVGRATVDAAPHRSDRHAGELQLVGDCAGAHRLAPARDPRRSWVMIAATVAALGLVAGLMFVGTRDEDAAVSSDGSLSSTSLPTAPPDEELPTLAFAGSDVEPGRYQTDLLGVTAAFDVPISGRLYISNPDRVLLADSFRNDSPFPVTTRTLSFARIAAWNTPEESSDDRFFGPGSIDADDLDAWIDANAVVVDARSTTTVDSRPTTVVDVRLEDSETNQTYFCPDPTGSCIWAASPPSRLDDNSRLDEILVSTGQINRFWLVRIGEYEPLLIHAAAAEGDEAWLDLVERTTVSTLRLGADVPPFSRLDRSESD